ncbi:hypothetical protein RQP46_009634 [Phenoliferia psychrophenolica]
MLFTLPSVLALLLALGANAESFNEKLCKADSSKKLAALEPTVYKMLSLHNCLQESQPELNDAVAACKLEAYGSDPWAAAGMAQIYCPHDHAKAEKVASCIKAKGLEDKHMASEDAHKKCRAQVDMAMRW